ncbi:uncharacterized protein [Setaria viridis]|uniref:uncharacterized protein n=1 Tax=Setaria viridis TaxID=4556 RepID=UPI003B3BC8FE
MDPNTKILLDEIHKCFSDELHKRFAESDLKWEHRFLEAERLHGDRIVKLEAAAKVFEEWRPQVDAAVDAVKLELGKLTRHWDRSVRDSASAEPGLFPTPQSASERPSASDLTADGPHGHRVDHIHRDDGYGSVFTHTSIPVKGASPIPNPTFPRSHSRPYGNHQDDFYQDSVHLGKLPKLQFPVFEGDNPKLWLSRCEDYFEMYRVDPKIWVKVAVMQFEVSSAAARWALSVDRQLKRVPWTEFSVMLIDRFGRDQQELLIRPLFHIKQTGTVAEYVAKFTELIDQLIAYGHSTDQLYYITRFIDGLRDDIRSTVLVQRPSTLDTACTLALLQEEVADPYKRRDWRRPEPGFPPRPPPRGPLPLPTPPRLDHYLLPPRTGR